MNQIAPLWARCFLGFLVLLIVPVDAAELSPKPNASSSTGYVNLNVAQFEALRRDTNHTVLDVRTAKEFSEGHIPGAINLDVKSNDFTEKAAKLDRSKTYLVHCAAGVRSVTACEILKPMKFTNLFNLEGGFRAWEKTAKP